MAESSAAAAPVRDRFLAFAFAAAEMLVEAGPDGVINFAAGAFRLRFGRDGAAFIGEPLANLIAPGDQAAFSMAMTGLHLRGRMPPIILRTADTAQTASSFAAMMMPGPPARLCFTIGAVPVPAAMAEAPGGIQTAARFREEAEALLRAGNGATMGLVELKGWASAREFMPADVHRSLKAGIAEVLTNAGGAMAGELGDGRFGVVGQGEADTAAMVAQLEKLLHGVPAGRMTRVQAAEISLERGSMAAPQAARALRYALSRFSEGGAEAAAASGAKGGLAGIIAEAEQRARGVREAIESQRFRLQFQPIVDLDTRQVHHYEALMRPIPTPGLPTQTTQDFVTFAEAVGLAELLDEAVLDQALMALRNAPAASVAVNISGLSMQNAPFRERVLTRIAAEGGAVAAGRLLVELTETAEIEDMSGAADSIARLRRAGVPVCLDDFGAGAAAFRYLKEFEIDIVKIDGSYVRAALGSPRERGFVSSMAELATSVGASVVAEMIETEEQARLMRSLGVGYGQGWLFGKPGMLPGGKR